MDLIAARKAVLITEKGEANKIYRQHIEKYYKIFKNFLII